MLEQKLTFSSSFFGKIEDTNIFQDELSFNIRKKVIGWCLFRKNNPNAAYKVQQKLMKSLLSVWHLLHSVKLMVKISPFFVAFLKYINFKQICENWQFGIWNLRNFEVKATS